MTQQFSPTAVIVIIAIVGAVYFLWSRSKPSPPEPAGWNDLVLCSVQTSIDSKKTLLLDTDFSAIVTDRKGNKLGEGKWSLADAQNHIFKIDAPGATGLYIVVSPPDSEGCLLGAIVRDFNQVDLHRSWFSEIPDPPEPDRD